MFLPTDLYDLSQLPKRTSNMKARVATAVGLCSLASAKTQLASKCAAILPSSTTVACVNKWAAVMPEPFSRFIADSFENVANDSFHLTSVPSDPSFNLARNANFIVFDEKRGLDILGSNPTYEDVLETIPFTHEAPVYVPSLNSIVYSVLGSDFSFQQLLNLTDSPPSIRNFTTDPPLLAVNGGRYFDGSIYWSVIGGIPFPNPLNESETVLQSPGIVRVDPHTMEAEFLLNNYFGSPLNSPDDLVVSRKTGDIFFADPWYGYGLNFSTILPPSAPMTYRFRPSTGQTFVVDDTIQQPNGIALSPDESVLYVTDSGLADFDKAPTDGSLPRFGFNRRGGRNVYAFDTRLTPAGYELINRRPIYLADEYIDDGFHATALQDPSDNMSYYLIGAAGNGVDIISPYGELLVRITADILVNNIQFSGRKEDGTNDLWLFGVGSIAKVTLNLKAMTEE